jgi:hypothetical protein
MNYELLYMKYEIRTTSDQPHLAQAGGKSPEKIEDALTKAKELIKEKLAE